MTPEVLTPEQRSTIKELQAEIRDLHLEANEQWRKYLKTRDEDCYDAVMALDGEIEMKGLIAHIPTAGEHKVGKVRKMIAKIKGQEGDDCDGCNLAEYESRVRALEGVNAWRAEYSLPPLERLPQGVPGDSHNCTLAMAFKMSLGELPDSYVYGVSVSDGNDITLEWKDSTSGLIQTSHPRLGTWGSALIGEFDENNWLDLLTDDALHTRFESMLENEGLIDALRYMDDLDAECARRDLMLDEQVWFGHDPAKSYHLVLGPNSTRLEVLEQLTG